MSRVGSFPLRTAVSALRRYAGSPKITFDPFCGKGTALLAARLVGSAAYGIDIAPEAVICTRAKLADVSLGELEEYLKKIRTGRPRIDSVPAPVRTFFHPITLAQIVSITARLQNAQTKHAGREYELSTVLLAALLGILHGHASYSLSISSAHAFAMSPFYVQRYAERHGLEPPIRDVKHCLLTKLRRCLSSPLPPPVQSRVVRGQAQHTATLFPHLRNRVDCILTSPPYLASHTYAKDNWLRHWMLGYDYHDIGPEYLQTGSLRKYTDQLRLILPNLIDLLRPGGTLICIVGHGRTGSQASPFNTADMRSLFKNLLTDPPLRLTLDLVRKQQVPSQKRYYHSLSTTTGHDSEPRNEYIFVAKKA
jgi:site-specific DNA-methyltransferase (adenine-specific)